VLTGIALVITLLAWVQGMRLTGRHPIPVTPILDALLLWKLTRRTISGASERLAA
jgi:hypothetical protein